MIRLAYAQACLLRHGSRCMSTHAGVKEMTATELSKLLDQQLKTDPFQKQIKLIDARERHEIEQHGRIHGAYNIPFSVFKNDKEIYSAALQDVFNGSKHDDTTVSDSTVRQSCSIMTKFRWTKCHLSLLYIVCQVDVAMK